MATTEPVNTQQVLQMGSHTEKLQQTLQHQSVILSQQLEEERINSAELKKSEVQNPESSQPADSSNPEGRSRSGRPWKKLQKQASDSTTEAKTVHNFKERLQGDRINIIT